jgi:hypothetical protein
VLHGPQPAAAAGGPPDPVQDPGKGRTGLKATIAFYRRLSGLSWPRRYPLIQFPNAPLIAAFLAGQAASRLHGTGHDDARAIAILAMTIWAYEELVHGVNRFRNLLGLAYVISTAVHLASALHR